MGVLLWRWREEEEERDMSDLGRATLGSFESEAAGAVGWKENPEPSDESEEREVVEKEGERWKKMAELEDERM